MIEAWLEKAVGTVWNYPVVGLCLFAGIFFTLRMAFVQLRCFPHALALISGKYDKEDEVGQITHFQALSAALSGTIGLGNIAGVAIAIAMGGPGAVLWMWVIAFFGMATKYVECALGTIYRETDPETGRTRGGPMHYITKGLGEKWKPMAIFFSVCCAIGCFGFANMFQGNQVASALTRYYGVPDWLTGLILCIGVASTIIGGINRIGAVAGKVVPFMCVFYLAAAFFVCLVNIDKLPLALSVILVDAFTGTAAAGGVVGTVIIIGVRRAVFSNEAGLGSAPIAHAAVKTNYPIREGIVASLGPMIDTILVCRATAMVIILAGNYGTERFEATHSIPLASEQQAGFALSGDWSFASDEVPPNTSSLQNLRSGDFALAFSGGSTASAAATPPLITYDKPSKGVLKKGVQSKKRAVASGMRFSCNHSGGVRHVELIDSENNLVARLKVGPGGDKVSYTDTKTKKEGDLISITPCSNPGEWHSHVISFTPHMQRRIRKNADLLGSMQLRFSADENTGTWYVDRPQAVKELTGVDLTSASFDQFFQGLGGFLIALAVCFFSYSTMVTWFYYGETAAMYVFGKKIAMPFRWVYCAVAFLGTITQLSIVLNFSDLMSGLMVIPNTIAILLLSPVVARETKKYFKQLKAGEFEPSNTQTLKAEVDKA